MSEEILKTDDKESKMKTLALCIHTLASAVQTQEKEIGVLWKIVIINLLLSIVLFFSMPAKAGFNEVEAKVGIPKNLLKAVCTVESGLIVGAYHPSDGGSPSYGRCQIKEITARYVGWTHEDVQDLIHGYSEIYYAGVYLKKQYDRYGNWYDAIAAYNMGRVRTDDFGGFVNANYVRKVLNACRNLECHLIK